MTRWRQYYATYNAAPQGATVAVAITVFVCGLLWQHAILLGVGAVLLSFALRRLSTGTNHESDQAARPPETAAAVERHDNREPAGDENAPPRRRASRDSIDPTVLAPEAPEVPGPFERHTSMDAYVNDLLAKERFALLLRPETKQHLAQAQVLRAIRQLDESMALVPAGRVLLGQLAEQSNSACGTAEVDPKLAKRNLIEVDPAYLDRFCVTNAQYQRFVDAGGYEQLEFWPEESLPALLDFIDQTGAPGPRYWSDGQYASGEGRFPVVGVSWYEASAYAAWVGKRLPSDALWTKAGAWPVESAPGRVAQRRYPWGESYDVRKAHLFGAGAKGPVAVDDYPGGVSVGGIHQLIGNVWEWTATPLVELGDPSLHVSESMISIRGGAFDTYFENHATCHYQSGEHPLSRRPNIGFRLALPMRDLEVSRSTAPPAVVNDSVEEVQQTELATTG